MSQPKETLHPGRDAGFGQEPEQKEPEKATKKPTTTKAEDAPEEE
jgi:hypothetical protein